MSGAAPKQGAKSQACSDNVPSSTKSSHTSTNADEDSTAAAEGGSDEEQQETPGGSGRQTSPEPNCAICLGQLENKSFTDSCFHMFCFVCLQEWSKVKAECPLCKQPFKSIIHNVKSYNNYDQFYLDHQRPPPQPLHFGWNFDRSFHYRTTLTMDHRYFNVPDLHMLNRSSAAPRDLSESAIYRRSIMPRYRLRSRTVHPLMRHHADPVSTTNFRQQIYASGRRVAGPRATLRRRTVSPEFFCSNPAQTHRLVPWLNRELNALLYSAENQVTFVLELIMDLIKRFPIDSEEFYEHIHPYLRHNTRHFMHEFLYFARSPYTMQTYDTKAIYEEPSHTVSSSGSSSNDNSDPVVVVDDDDDDDDDEVERTGFSGRRFDTLRTSSPWHSSSQAASAMMSIPNPVMASRWDSPTPGPSWDLSGNSSQSPVNVDDSSDSDASTIIDPTYAAPESTNSQQARLPSPEVSDEEAVIFVSYDKPWEERSPIQLSSGSEDESFSQFIKALKQENKRRKRARSLAGSVETNHQSKRRACDRSRSSTPPVQEHTRSSTSSHDVSSQQDRHHRRHRHESSEGSRHSSRSGRKEKRKSSHSRNRSSKKRCHDASEKDDLGESDANPKKRKHKKKHRKNKERDDKHSKRQADGHKTGVSESAISTTTSEKVDSCKKHPSGHKKSRVTGTGDGGEAESKEGSSGHHSDSLLSDNSTSSGSGTATTTSLTNTERNSVNYFSRQQRVRQALQDRQRQAFLPVFPGMDLTPSWENISRLASMLASHTSSQLAAMPGPSQSSSDPVVISTSSDDSDVETSNGKYGSDRLTTDSIHVAKTVVVPCSSNPEMPTAAIDLAGTPASASSLRPVEVNEYIDVDSISSEEDNSDDAVVNVESLEDTDDSITEPFISSNFQGTNTKMCTSSVSELSAEMKRFSSAADSDSVKPPVSSSCLPFSIDSILNTDVFMGVDLISQSLRQTSTVPSLDMPMSSQDFSLTHSQPQSMRGDDCINHQAINFVSTLGQYNSHQQSNTVQPHLSTDVTGSPQHAEDQVSRNCVKTKEANPSEVKINAANDTDSDHDSARVTNDQNGLMNSCFEENDNFIDNQQPKQGAEDSMMKEKEADTVSNSVHSVEHSDNAVHKNETEKVSVTERQDIGKDLTENCKDNEDDDSILNILFSADVVEDEEDAEKLLLSEPEQTCAFNDQEKSEASGDSVSSNQEEQFDVCKSHLLHNPSLCLQTSHENSSSLESEVKTGFTTSVDTPVKGTDCLPTAGSDFPKSEANTGVVSVDSSVIDVPNTPSNCASAGSVGEHLTCGNHDKTSVTDVTMPVGGQCSVIPINEQNGSCSDGDSFRAFENDCQSHEVISNPIVGQLANPHYTLKQQVEIGLSAPQEEQS